MSDSLRNAIAPMGHEALAEYDAIVRYYANVTRRMLDLPLLPEPGRAECAQTWPLQPCEVES